MLLAIPSLVVASASRSVNSCCELPVCCAPASIDIGPSASTGFGICQKGSDINTQASGPQSFLVPFPFDLYCIIATIFFPSPSSLSIFIVAIGFFGRGHTDAVQPDPTGGLHFLIFTWAHCGLPLSKGVYHQWCASPEKFRLTSVHIPIFILFPSSYRCVQSVL